MSVKEKIIQYLREHPFEWVHKGTLERAALLEWGAEADNCARRCRELAEDGEVEARENQKGHMEYHYKTLMQRIQESTPEPQEIKKQEQLTLRI